MNVPKDVLARIQARQERIRNICVLAHVDHGKTTLSDNLIAANSIISSKLVGEMRYLDSRDDEQQRGITMKSSSISLLHVPQAHARDGGIAAVSVKDQLQEGYLVNLIDSPGHVDFCSEVATAVRLCDGALLVVDAVEGVCVQTHAVLRQAWAERVTPTLVINKVDRLVTEVRLTPAEAYERLTRIVEEANGVLAALTSAQFLQRADESAEAAEAEWYEGDAKDEEDVFDPGKGNVLFCSAVDGWGFTVPQFGHIYASKFGFSPSALARALWGPYTLQMKAGKGSAAAGKGPKIVPLSKAHAGALPMFAQLVLGPLWSAYEAVEPWSDGPGILRKIVRSQGLNVPDKIIDAAGRAGVQAVMSAWLPLAEGALTMAVTHLPPPTAAAPLRAPHLTASCSHLPPDALALLPPAAEQQLQHTLACITASSASADAPAVAFISKMVAVPAAAIPLAPGEARPADPTREVFLGFGRVFSGVLRPGARVHVLSPLYSVLAPSQQRQTVQVTGLYLMMGRALERLAAAPAGNVVAIGGLEEAVLKSATLATTPAAPPLAPVEHQADAIVQVAVEPALPSDLPALERGLQLLNRADAFVQVSLSEATGEWLLGAAGEIHLETCLKDLRERFARVELLVSPPLVSFKESVVHPAEVPEDSAEGAAKASDTIVETVAAGGKLRVRARALPLPAASAAALETAAPVAGVLRRAADSEAAAAEPVVREQLDELREGVAAGADDAKDQSLGYLQNAWMLGPSQTGPNVLIWRPASDPRNLFNVPAKDVLHVGGGGRAAGKAEAAGQEEEDAEADEVAEETGSQATAVSAAGQRLVALPVGAPTMAEKLQLRPASEVAAGVARDSAKAPAHLAIESGISAGFHMACAAGPLCQDPLWGVAMELSVGLVADEFDFSKEAWATLDLSEGRLGPVSGQVMTAVAAACRRAVEEAGVRLVEAHYRVEVATSTRGLDAATTTVKARRGRIMETAAREGQDLFVISAQIPVEACLSKRGGGETGGLSFADELRRLTSGAASASLSISHWERLQVDPHWTPASEELREEHGEDAELTNNLAKRLANVVRQRKGLPLIGAKVVEDATKQRTRARKV